MLQNNGHRSSVISGETLNSRRANTEFGRFLWVLANKFNRFAMQTQDRWQWQDSSNQVHQAGNLSIRNRASFRMVRNLSPFFGRLIGDPLARVPVRQGHQRSTPVIPDAENASPPIPVQLVSKHLLAT